MWRLCSSHPGELHLSAEQPLAPRVLRLPGETPALLFLSGKARGDGVSLIRRSASPPLWTAVSSSTTASRTARSTTTSGAARSAQAARSPSRAAASPPWARSSTRSTLCAPSAWSSSTKEHSRSRTRSPTATAASLSSSVQTAQVGGGAWSNQVCAGDSSFSPWKRCDSDKMSFCYVSAQRWDVGEHCRRPGNACLAWSLTGWARPF